MENAGFVKEYVASQNCSSCTLRGNSVFRLVRELVAHSEPESSRGGKFSFNRCNTIVSACSQQYTQKAQVKTYLLQFIFQARDHVLHDDDTLLVQVLDDVLVVLAVVDVDDDGLDGRVALD